MDPCEEISGTLVAAVLPSELAMAVTMRNQHIPILLAAVHQLERQEGVEGIYEREARIDRDIEGKFGVDVGQAAAWRAALLCRLLTSEDPLYHDIGHDGTVTVDPELLAYAASAAISDEPDESLFWPQK